VTHIKQQKFVFIASRAVVIIRTVYYIHDPCRGDENNFLLFLYVSRKPIIRHTRFILVQSIWFTGHEVNYTSE